MKTDFVTLLKRSRLMKWGLAGLVAGLGLLGYAGLNTPPSRDSLTVIAGVLAEGKQSTTTRKKRGQSAGAVVSTSYELGLRQDSGEIKKITVDGAWVTRGDIEGVMTRIVVAEVDSDNHAMALTTGGRAVLRYEDSARSYDSDNKMYREIGAPLTLAGFPLLLFGWFWSRRSLARGAAGKETDAAQTA